MKLAIFTPTWCKPDGSLAVHPDCAAAIQSQRVRGGMEWLVGTENPHPIGDHRNTLQQYQVGRDRFLTTGADALLLVEHDNILPDPDAAQRLLDTLADVVYGVYLFRHGSNVINAYTYEGDRNLGQSMTLYPGEIAKARARNVVRVSGCGFGCTLIRRNVVQRIPFRGQADSWAPDVPFAHDCLKAGVMSAARFDVACGHYHAGIRLEPFIKRAQLMRVMAQIDVNVMVEGQVLRMHTGQVYDVPENIALDLSRANYAQIMAPQLSAPESATIEPTASAMLPASRKRRAG